MTRNIETRRKWFRERYHSRRAEAIRLLGSKCVQCNSTDNLEIDHVDPGSKVHKFTYYTYLSHDKFIEEVGKCQLLCQKCHREKSKIDGSSHKGKRLGEHCNLSKLTELDVIEIRRLAAENDFSYRDIASMFEVSKSNVSLIVRRKTWNHV